MNRLHHLTFVLAAATMVALAGCSSPQSEPVTTPSVQETTAAVAEATPTPTLEVTSETPVSDIEAAVQTFVGALEELGIEHSEPVRAEVGGSGAKARFDMTVNGFAAGINVFPDAQTLDAWGELSDAYGGIFVSSGTAVLTLNSSEGIGNSAEIAPSIADVVGGEARGV